MAPLGPTDLHVWTVALRGLPAPDDLYGGMFSAAELARAAQFVRAQDRDAFLHGHGALRSLLARYLGTVPPAIELVPGAWGKPELAGALAASGLTFNLTHAGGLALIVIGRARPVGIDVEAVRAMPEAAGIARRMLGAPVAAALEQLDAPARDRAFLGLWTAQEACIKALGLALAVASETVRVGLAAGGAVCEWVDPVAAPHGLVLAPLATEPGHVAALAWIRRAAAQADGAVRVVRFVYTAQAQES